MNTKALYAACLFAALNVCAFAAQADIKPQSANYGAHLDIQKVLSSKQNQTASCGLVNTHLTYLDSAGQTQNFDYLEAADTCHNQNG